MGGKRRPRSARYQPPLSAPNTAGSAPTTQVIAAAIPTQSTLTALYQSFSFQKGHEPVWAVMRSIFLGGASFVDPLSEGAQPRAEGATIPR